MEVRQLSQFVYYDENNEYLCLAQQDDTKILFDLKTGAISAKQRANIRQREIELLYYPQPISKFKIKDPEEFAKKNKKNSSKFSLLHPSLILKYNYTVDNFVKAARHLQRFISSKEVIIGSIYPKKNIRPVNWFQPARYTINYEAFKPDTVSSSPGPTCWLRNFAIEEFLEQTPLCNIRKPLLEYGYTSIFKLSRLVTKFLKNKKRLEKIKEMKGIFAYINLGGSHWVAYWLKREGCFFYDSFYPVDNYPMQDDIKKFVKALGWESTFQPGLTEPLQKNTYDCGVFVCYFALREFGIRFDEDVKAPQLRSMVFQSIHHGMEWTKPTEPKPMYVLVKNGEKYKIGLLGKKLFVDAPGDEPVECLALPRKKDTVNGLKVQYFDTQTFEVHFENDTTLKVEEITSFEPAEKAIQEELEYDDGWTLKGKQIDGKKDLKGMHGLKFFIKHWTINGKIHNVKGNGQCFYRALWAASNQKEDGNEDKFIQKYKNKLGIKTDKSTWATIDEWANISRGLKKTLYIWSGHIFNNKLYEGVIKYRKGNIKVFEENFEQCVVRDAYHLILNNNAHFRAFLFK